MAFHIKSRRLVQSRVLKQRSVILSVRTVELHGENGSLGIQSQEVRVALLELREGRVDILVQRVMFIAMKGTCIEYVMESKQYVVPKCC